MMSTAVRRADSLYRCTRATPSPNATLLAPAQPLPNPAEATFQFDPFTTSIEKGDMPLGESGEGWQCQAFPNRRVLSCAVQHSRSSS